MNLHEPACDCFECSSDPVVKRLHNKFNKANVVDQSGRTPYNLVSYKDNLEGFDDNRYLDGKVKAVVPIALYKSPGGTLLKTFSSGNTVGYIYSALLKPDGIWLMIDNAYAKVIGYIKFEPWKFDLTTLDKSVKEKEKAKESLIAEKVEERKAANTSPLYQTGTKVVKAGTDIASGVVDVASGTLGTIGFIGRNMKYIIILLIIALVVYVFNSGKKFV
jgi:hypothetical protein